MSDNFIFFETIRFKKKFFEENVSGKKNMCRIKISLIDGSTKIGCNDFFNFYLRELNGGGHFHTIRYP